MWFTVPVVVGNAEQTVVFFHGGWGKIPATASTQYAIDRWTPPLVVNLGTCGGFGGEVEVGTILLVERTVVYDIIDRMENPDDAIQHFATQLDLSWLREPFPMPVRRAVMLSADQDLHHERIPYLRLRYNGIAADWESGAISYTAAMNNTRCLILRGVSDIVHSYGGEVYSGNFPVFVERAQHIVQTLLKALPAWLACAAQQPTA